MADTSTIEWTDATWNPVTGCTMVSAGCTNCYAMGLAATRLKHHPSRKGLTRKTGGRDVWTGEVRFNEGWLTQPLKWSRPRMIFVCAHGDLFHESVPDEWLDKIFAVMALASHHTFQVLTKRPERARAYLTGLDHPPRKFAILLAARKTGAHLTDTMALNGAIDQLPLRNVWLGTSVEDQATADERIPHLLATPAAVRFLSCEPMLGPIELQWSLGHPVEIAAGFLQRGQFSPGMEKLRPIDWVICGGESGKNARPMHPDWTRSLRDQCVAAGMAFFFKQWGEWFPSDRGELYRGDKPASKQQFFWTESEDTACYMMHVGKKAAGRLLDGREWNEVPG